jgi:sec-independent protein translocase protein TatB
MFDVGFWELIILFGLGLIILGPERLPKVAMQVGNWAGQARRMARQLSGQIRSELNDINIENEIDIKDPFPSASAGHSEPQYNRPGVDDLDPTSSVDPSPTDERPPDEESHAHSPEADDTAANNAD